jgi:hypothetical protein
MISEVAKYKGIKFFIAIGNDGASGIITNLSPGSARNSIGVGSFDTNKVFNFKAFDTKNPKFVLRKYKEL